jgi:hypothetical protein
LGDVPLHLRGGTIVPMQKRPALVARDVRLSPLTLVVALPTSAATEAVGPVPAYALEETCNAARALNPGRRVACGNLFMDSGDDIAVSTDNSVQVCCVVLLVCLCWTDSLECSLNQLMALSSSQEHT